MSNSFTPQANAVEHNPFEGPEILRVIPTTEPQLEIWLSCMLGGADANKSYNESVSLLLNGKLNTNHLQKALKATIRNHEALRYSFSGSGKQICIYKALPLRLRTDDLSALTPQEKSRFILSFHDTEANAAFNLTEGALFRFSLFQLSENVHYLTLTAHHIICDGWSLGILLQTISQCYNEYSAGSQVTAYKAIPYSKYALIQSKFYQSAAYKEAEDYWLKQYADKIPVVDLPTSHPRPAQRTYKSRRDDYPLSATAVNALKAVGANNGCSFVTTLLATFEILLHKVTGQNDLIVGIPTAGQAIKDMYHLVGHCVHLLPLRSRQNPIQNFSTYLKQRKKQLLADYEHQELTFGSLIKKLPIKRDSSRIPLVPVVFNIDMGMDDKVSFTNIKHKLYYNPRSYESFEIFLNISSSNDNELELEWSYNTQLFSSVLIHDMMEDFVGIIKQVCDNPNIIIEDIKIKKAYQAKAPIQIPEIIEVAPFKEEAHLTTIIPPTIDVLVAPAALATMALSNPLDIVQIKPIEEGNKVAEAATTAPEEVVMSDEPEIANAGETDELLRQVNEWNSTALSYRESTITAMVESMAATQPDSPAIVFEGLTTTYKQLNNKANQIAKLLVEMNIKPGQGVGLCLHRSPLMVAGLLGILKAGAAYIPIDPVYPKERIAYMLAQSQATVLITENRLAHNTYSNTRNVIIDDELTNLTRFFVDNIQTPLAKPGDLAYILFTSGSTGNPKGVEVTHDNVVNLLHSMNQIFELGNKEQMLASTTISFDIAGLEMFLPLVTGNTMVLAPSAVAKDGPALLKFIQHHRITWMQATPATYKMLLASGWNEKLAIKVSCCGEQLPKDLADKMLTRCQAFYNMYGPTETTIYSSGIKLEPHYGTITIGRPIHNTAFYILDANLKLCPPNTEGEIYIGGKGVAKGYIHQPELTKERFIPNPYSTTGVPAPILFRTGDLGKWTETGNIICLGRTDHQIKVRGYRIELPEIEYQLKQIDGIKDAVVAAHPDPTGEKQLVAYIVATNDSFDKNNINKILKNVLPAYMIPVHYVGMDVLPLSESRKVDRKALPAPQNIFTTPTSVGAMTEQHSELHTTLANIWKKTLGISTISIHDDFFTIGGHSLVAIEVMNAIAAQTGAKLPITALFEYPTIAGLATLIEGKEAAKQTLWKCLVPIKPHGNKPPLYIVHGNGLTVMVFHGLAKHLHPEQPVYGLQARGLDNVDEAQNNMEEIALTYINEILEHNPNGPYCLAGYSFGGIVAFEMAKQLTAMGKKVNMVGIFDTYAGNNDRFLSPVSRLFKKLFRQIPKLLFVISSYIKHPSAIAEYQRYLFNKRFRGIDSEAADPSQKLPNEDHILSLHDEAMYNYRLSPYKGRIDLFRAQLRVYFLDDLTYLGWQPYAQKGVQIHEVPGDHKTLFFPPLDAQVAAIVQKVLDERNRV